MHARQVVDHYHGKIGGAGGDVAGVEPDGVRGGHARAGVAFRGTEGDPGLQFSRWIEEPRAGFCQMPGGFSGGQNAGQQIGQLPGAAPLREKRVRLFRHSRVVCQSGGVDGEHAGCLADAEDPDAGQKLVDIARDGIDVVQPGDVLLAV